VLDLSRLSTEQRQAVLAPPGPLALIAGPGSGKTTVLVARIAALIALGHVTPETVLALTFTTAAARTLRARLYGVLGDQATAIDVQTFHALGLRIIRQWSAELGFGLHPPTVYGDGDARELLCEVIATIGFTPGERSLPELARRLKRYRLQPFDREVSDALGALATAYEGLLQQRHAVDYPAMLVLPLRLFTTHPPALRVLQDAYRAILCDEAQDVCAAQYQLLHLLAARHRHLMLVGDPRQTLYGWRGADHRFLRTFADDFRQAQILRLDQNFRSSGHIVAIANVLGTRLAETQPLWTTNPPGDLAFLYVADDEQDEARFVVTEIERLLASGAIDHVGEVAVLYRTNRQAAELTLACLLHRLPYWTRGHGDLFDRREVRDALAYLRLVYHPSDVASLMRIANVPPRQLGWVKTATKARPPTLAELVSLARQRGSAAVTQVEPLSQLIADLHKRRGTIPAPLLLDEVLERSRYRVWLASQPDGVTRLASLSMLRRLIEQVASDTSEQEPDAWLAELALGDVDDRDNSTDAQRVLLATIHRVKGDEARVVFVVGMEEGLLPHMRTLAESQDHVGVVTECQVAYVAVTRARERLYLTCCRSRRRGDWIEVRRPSRFLSGLPLTPIERAA
jgi:DNA helicase-2/ATP-dependent DNA helicase PcrA